MWILFLSLFILAKAVTEDIECDDEFMCPRPSLYRQIPLTVSEFNEACPELASHIECWREYDTKCAAENEGIFDKPETYEKLITLFNEICDQKSALYKAATGNLECFNETFSQTNCSQEWDAFLEPYMIEEFYDDFTSSKSIPERVYCLSEILYAECILKDITKKCGLRVRQASVEYMHRSEYIDLSCPPSYRKGLLEALDEFKLSKEQIVFSIFELERMKILDEA